MSDVEPLRNNPCIVCRTARALSSQLSGEGVTAALNGEAQRSRARLDWLLAALEQVRQCLVHKEVAKDLRLTKERFKRRSAGAPGI